MEDNILLKPNKERVLFLDVLKFVAIMTMAIIHTGNIIIGFDLTAESFNPEIVNLISNIIYHVSPTIFMFAMGASINLTKHKDPSSLMLRGFNVFLLSIGFNALRGLIVAIFYSLILEGYSLGDFFYEIADWAIGNDILMFAGLFFIIFGLLSYCKRKNMALALTAIVLYLISLAIPYGFETGFYLLDSFLGNFILIGESYFPVITWFIIPTMGYFFFKLFNKSLKKDLFMIKSAFIAFAIFALALCIILLTKTFQPRYFLWGEAEFYFDLPTLVLTLSLNYIYIPLVYFISKQIAKTNKLKALIVFESNNLTKIYLTHWIVVLLSGIIFTFSDITANNALFVVLYGLFVVVVSSLIVLLLSKSKKEG